MRYVHIGEQVRKRAKELRIGPTELGRLINTSKQNVYGIYRRRSVDTELLHKLSKALQFDFFQYFATDKQKLAQEDLTGYPSTTVKLKKEISSLKEQIGIFKKEIMELKEKCELLIKINNLLEKKQK